MKKVISVLISAVMVIGMLSSCKQNEDDSKENLVESVYGYVQTVMDFDKVPSNYKSVKLKNDRVYFTYLSEQDGTYSYEALKINGQALEEAEIPEWMEHDNKKEITDWTEDGNGNVYIIYKDSPSVTKYSGSDKSYTEIISGENIIEKIFISTDNSLVLKSGENVYVYDEKTELINTIKVWNSFYSDVFVYENSIIARADKNSGYAMYDIKDGTKKGEVTTSDFPISNSMKITSDEEGNLYIACINGIYLRKNGSKIWEQIANNKNNILADINEKLYDFISLGENLYISSQGKLYRYSYTETITKEVFRIVAIGNFSNGNILDSANSLQKKYPDLIVNYEYAFENTSSDKVEAMIKNNQILNDDMKKINTEIMAGKGPDVFLLDRVPVETRKEYASKGVFLDLSSFVDGLIQTDEYVDSYLKAYEKDGNIYYIPTFALPVFLMVKDEAADHVSDLKSLAEYSGITDDYVFDPYYYKYLEDYIDLIFKNYSDFYYEDTVITKDDMSDFLKYSKQIYDSLNKNDQNVFIDPDLLRSAHGIYENMFKYENIAVGFEEIGMVKETEGYKVIPTGKFSSGCVVAINSRSDNIDAAKDFIEILLSHELNETINKKYIENYIANRNLSVQDPFYELTDYKNYYLDTEDAEKYISSLDNFDIPMLNWTGTNYILDVLLEFEPAYLKGEASLEETLSQIMNRIDLMQNE